MFQAFIYHWMAPNHDMRGANMRLQLKEIVYLRKKTN